MHFWLSSHTQHGIAGWNSNQVGLKENACLKSMRCKKTKIVRPDLSSSWSGQRKQQKSIYCLNQPERAEKMPHAALNSSELDQRRSRKRLGLCGSPPQYAAFFETALTTTGQCFDFSRFYFFFPVVAPVHAGSLDFLAAGCFQRKVFQVDAAWTPVGKFLPRTVGSPSSARRLRHFILLVGGALKKFCCLKCQADVQMARRSSRKNGTIRMKNSIVRQNDMTAGSQSNLLPRMMENHSIFHSNSPDLLGTTPCYSHVGLACCSGRQLEKYIGNRKNAVVVLARMRQESDHQHSCVMTNIKHWAE